MTEKSLTSHLPTTVCHIYCSNTNPDIRIVTKFHYLKKHVIIQ